MVPTIRVMPLVYLGDFAAALILQASSKQKSAAYGFSMCRPASGARSDRLKARDQMPVGQARIRLRRQREKLSVHLRSKRLFPDGRHYPSGRFRENPCAEAAEGESRCIEHRDDGVLLLRPESRRVMCSLREFAGVAERIRDGTFYVLQLARPFKH